MRRYYDFRLDRWLAAILGLVGGLAMAVTDTHLPYPVALIVAVAFYFLFIRARFWDFDVIHQITSVFTMLAVGHYQHWDFILQMLAA